MSATLSAPAEVIRLSSENGYHVLRLESGEDVSAKCILIATGASYRKLTIDGCERLEGSGVYYAATVVGAQLCGGAQVVVVGGGNSAGQAAVFLSERADHVRLLLRGDDLGKNMSQYLTRRIEQTANIEVRRHTEISKMHGDKSLASVELTCSQTGQSDTVECLAVFVFIGAVSHTTWLPDAIQADRNGFVRKGADLNGVGSVAASPPAISTGDELPGHFCRGGRAAWLCQARSLRRGGGVDGGAVRSRIPGLQLNGMRITRSIYA